MCDTCPILAARNEELEARVADLERHVFNRDWIAPRELGLTPAQAAMVQLMLRCGERHASKELLLEATRLSRAYREDVDLAIVDVWICRTRSKFKPFGLKIETVWGLGFRLEPETVARLLNWPRATAEAA